MKVDTSKFYRAWGEQPKGKGLYGFSIAGTNKFFEGTFSQARAKAIAWATKFAPKTKRIIVLATPATKALLAKTRFSPGGVLLHKKK